MKSGGDKQYNRAEEGGTVYAVQHGDQTINYYLGISSRIREYIRPDPPSREWLAQQPSRLLQASSGVLDLIGRREELELLSEWRDSTNSRSALLLHGAGGEGKSRLAMEFVSWSAQLGWQILEGIQRDEASHDRLDSAPTIDVKARGTLLVVDYADRWAHRDLFSLYLEFERLTTGTTRILLIGRSVKWWPAMRGELDEIGVEHGDLKLGKLGGSTSEAETVFRHAVYRYAEVLSIGDVSAIETRKRLLEQTEGLALNILSLALVAVDSYKRGKTLPARREDLAAYLLDREYRNWARLYSAGLAGQDFSTRPSSFSKVVFVAALCGELPYEGAVAVLQSAHMSEPAVLLDNHRLCYPPADRSKMLGPLYPDRLAEDFIALLLPGHDVTGFDPDPWALSVPTALLTTLRAVGARLAVRRMITFLAASAERWPHVVTFLSNLLDDDPHAAVEAGSEAISSIARNEGIPIATIDLVDAAFPSPSEYDLATAEAAVMERVAGHYLAQAAPWRQAEINYKLGTRLHKAGRSREALGPLKSAASEFARWTASAGTEIEHDGRELHASALTNRATVLTHLGELEEALETEKVVLVVRETLAREDEERYAADYADTLTNLAVDYWYLGMIDDAIEVSERSVEVRRRTSAETEDALDDLARSLSNHGMVLNTAGRKQESLVVMEEAVMIYRKLAESNPDVHSPHFAMALGNLAAGAGDMELNNDSMRYSVEAIAVLRDLNEVNPELYSRELATALDNAGQRALAMGSIARSINFLIEARDIRESLASANPLAYDSQLADSLQNLGTAFERSDTLVEALKVWTDSLAIRRRVFARAPERSRDELIKILSIVAEARYVFGDHVESQSLVQEALSVHRSVNSAEGVADPLPQELQDLALRLEFDG